MQMSYVQRSPRVKRSGSGAHTKEENLSVETDTDARIRTFKQFLYMFHMFKR